METALRRMGEMLEATLAALGDAFSTDVPVVWSDPSTWPLGLWLLVAAFVILLLLASVRRRTSPSLDVRPPEILITQGELVPDARTGRLGAGSLTMVVSNLGRYPVQLLETASRSGGGRFGVAESVALIPAMGEVEVSVRLPVGKLEDGELDLFCYAAATRTKTWRHRAELVWEPWAKRFKVAPLEQRIEPTRQLASGRRDVVRMDDVTKALSAAAKQAEVSATHSGARSSEISPRPARRERPAAAANALGSAGARLSALVEAKRPSPVTPPPDGNGSRAGAAARAQRPSNAAPTAPTAPPTPSSAAAPTAPASASPPARPSAAPSATQPGTSSAPRPAPAGPARATPNTTAAPVDPDAPTVPARPRDRTLEFPDDF